MYQKKSSNITCTYSIDIHGTFPWKSSEKFLSATIRLQRNAFNISIDLLITTVDGSQHHSIVSYTESVSMTTCRRIASVFVPRNSKSSLVVEDTTGIVTFRLIRFVHLLTAKERRESLELMAVHPIQ